MKTAYERHLSGYPAYTDDHEWVGDVFRCLPTPECNGCGRWHGYTRIGQSTENPQMSLHGFSSRDDVCRALQAVRQAWSHTARPGGQ
ncbi:hypothetical protein SSP24_33370 [Streptomyces spinoverrucosus]|uniref:Uncharacterized protein n=1 Tax=Streptomyces spinoverrucosus TaxID=284043 RepID=A0A4Y3VEZ7_9ACTN|nr:hypothetical protein [Streptomyces spinoverrucosus]GEC05682.1 hypothetical protein SSP24_33370 [Streptomyces spinoverrucosus]GHB78074.1 hypothetical protein GCM10010397_55880 [Streptomyces spinoverrucosus]